MQNGKLQYFRKIVLEDADSESKRMVEDADRQLLQKAEEDEKFFVRKEESLIADAHARFEKRTAQAIAHAAEEGQARLLTKRMEILDSIRDDVIKKLRDFSKTDEYKAWILDKVDRERRLFDNAAAVAYVTKEDLRFEDELLAAGVSSVKESGEDIIGGIIFSSEESSAIADYSFKNAVDWAMDEFHEIKISE